MTANDRHDGSIAVRSSSVSSRKAEPPAPYPGTPNAALIELEALRGISYQTQRCVSDAQANECPRQPQPGWSQRMEIGSDAVRAIGAFIGLMVVGWGGRLVSLIIGATRKLPISSFIVTLGLLSALRGAAKGVGGNQPIYPDSEWLNTFMRTGESGLTSILAPGVWIMLGLALFVGALLRYTRFGRHIFAIGSNEQTARLCGVPVAWVRIRVFMLALACTGLAAVFQFAYLDMGDPTTAEGYELRVIAACVIGGASLAGGSGSVAGALAGALLMTVIANGCTKLGMDNWVQEIVTGGIIIVAVLLDQLRHARRD